MVMTAQCLMNNCRNLAPDHEAFCAKHRKGPTMPIDPKELEDLIADAIADSLDVDWSHRDGARAVMRALASEGWAVVARPIDAAPDLLEALRGWDKLHSDMIAAGGALDQLPDGEIERFAAVQRDLIDKTRVALAKADCRP